ncbi:MAG: proton-conducting transporter transmembrane domain-containing protein [Myxococcales bacterium]
MLWLIVLTPFALAGLALVLPPARLPRPILLLAGALLHACAVAEIWVAPPTSPSRWLGADPLGKIVLTTTSALFLACATYAQGYLRRRPDRDDRVFVAGLLAFLGAMTLAALSQHLGLLWVAVEATTLASAPLVYFDHDARSLEATWKYLLLCSVGIALALLGTFLVGLAAANGEPAVRSLSLSDLRAGAAGLSPPWLEAAFVFILVGYGTKMGLAPLHSWKPDAYGEAPALVGALLSGALTNCAFLGILRPLGILRAAGHAGFALEALVVMGLFSMALAAVFVVGQRDFKRMLAYSSVEHMGILAFGVGLGGAAVSGAMFHIVNNGLTKGVLFLSAGNIHRSFGSKRLELVRGAARRLPVSGPLFLLGFLAITGSPPFGPFFSEFAILNGAFAGGRFLAGALFLGFLAVVFIGMAATVLHVVQGNPEGAPEIAGMGDSTLTAAPPLVLLATVTLLGLWLPGPLHRLFQAAAAQLGGF